MRIGMVCYPTFGGSGVVATELGKALAAEGHEVHFITYDQPVRLGSFRPNVFYHEVRISQYPLFDYPPYELVLASKWWRWSGSKTWICCMCTTPYPCLQRLYGQADLER